MFALDNNFNNCSGPFRNYCGCGGGTESNFSGFRNLDGESQDYPNDSNYLPPPQEAPVVLTGDKPRIMFDGPVLPMVSMVTGLAILAALVYFGGNTPFGGTGFFK